MGGRESGIRHARGMNIVEVLLVIGILALLVALLLPAVQNVREGAHRVSCFGRLHEIGIAIHQYLSANHCLPPGQVTGRHANNASAHCFLLPYIGEKPLYDTINFDAAMGAPPNETITRRTLRQFICPTDYHPVSDNRMPLGSANYAACFGSGSWGDPLDGAFVPFCGGDPIFHWATQGDPIGHRPTSAFCAKQMGVLTHLFDLLRTGDEFTRDLLLSWATGIPMRETA